MVIHDWDPDPFVDMGNPKVAGPEQEASFYDFHLTAKSPAIGKGIAAASSPITTTTASFARRERAWRSRSVQR